MCDMPAPESTFENIFSHASTLLRGLTSATESSWANSLSRNLHCCAVAQQATTYFVLRLISIARCRQRAASRCERTAPSAVVCGFARSSANQRGVTDQRLMRHPTGKSMDVLVCGQRLTGVRHTAPPVPHPPTYLHIYVSYRRLCPQVTAHIARNR